MKDIIIFDLDGTLALIDHRRHLVEGKKRRWKDFFAACVDDAPHKAVIAILHALHPLYSIYIVSGRSDEVRAQTEDWLALHEIPFHQLIMRKEGDYTPDDILKLSWVNSGLIPKERILCIFHDRDKVVKMWRNADIACFQVAEGNFYKLQQKNL